MIAPNPNDLQFTIITIRAQIAFLVLICAFNFIKAK